MEEEKDNSINYTQKEIQRNGFLMARILEAKTARDTSHIAFNNQTYIQWFNNNEKIANTRITKDKDLSIHMGTVEQKLITILAEVNRLNLTGEVRVYDKNDEELEEFGTALTDICDKTAEQELDDEKKIIRQLELIKQGTVFIQDNWVKRWKTSKKLKGKFTGKVKGVEWTDKLEKVFDGPERQVLYGPGVYLGDISEFEIKKQPFIFTTNNTSYEEAKSRYGMKDKDGKDVWERWNNVPRKKVTIIDEINLSTLSESGGWSLTDLEQDRVEEIHYQDQINDEYQIYLNGVAMLPAGFPLSAITPNGMFNVEKQVLYVINPFFAYGRSLIAKTEQLSKLLDEMIKLLIIKTRKSIHPPYANISGKVISEKSLMPGAISMGIDPQALIPIGTESQGATASEYKMLEILKESIDNVTISPQLQGQQGKTGQTAFEVGLLQAQGEKTIALIIFACSLLEKKTTWLRANYNLAYYFDPIGTKVDEARDTLVNTFRTTSTNTTLPNRGAGIRKIKPVDNTEGITSESIYNEEELTGTPIPKKGRRKTREELDMDPLQIMYLDINILKKNKYVFFIEVISKPKDNSQNAKLMFREELRDLAALQSFGSKIKPEGLENEYALIWNKRKEKLFSKPIQQNVLEANQDGSKVLNENIPKLLPESSGEQMT